MIPCFHCQYHLTVISSATYHEEDKVLEHYETLQCFFRGLCHGSIGMTQKPSDLWTPSTYFKRPEGCPFELEFIIDP